MSPISVLLLRTNVDWSALQGSDLSMLSRTSRASRRLKHAERRNLPSAIDMWNGVFGISFAAYRRRLRAIAELNWSGIKKLDLFIKTSTIHTVLRNLRQFVVFPVDDDDWFCPRIVEVLRRSAPADADAVWWPDGVFGLDLRRRLATAPQAWRRRRAHFATNDYAVTARGYHSLDERSAARVLLNHGVAARTFSKQGKTAACIGRYLSVTCKSLASSLNLAVTTSASQLVDNLTAHMTAPCVVPRGLGWASPYIEMARQLNRELLESVLHDPLRKDAEDSESAA